MFKQLMNRWRLRRLEDRVGVTFPEGFKATLDIRLAAVRSRIDVLFMDACKDITALLDTMELKVGTDISTRMYQTIDELSDHGVTPEALAALEQVLDGTQYEACAAAVTIEKHAELTCEVEQLQADLKRWQFLRKNLTSAPPRQFAQPAV